MQIQKDEIRNRILSIAMDEFSQRGYRKTTMKTIARKSGIAVGDIYTYFHGKDALFKSLLGSTVETVKQAVTSDDFLLSKPSEAAVEANAREVAEKFIKIRKPLLILLHNCEGSCYENIRSDLVHLACKRIVAEGSEPFRENPYIAEAIAVAVINGAIHIFCRCSHNLPLFSTTLAAYNKLVIQSLTAQSMPRTNQ